MARTQPWKVSEEWWEKVKPLVPAAPSPDVQSAGGSRQSSLSPVMIAHYRLLARRAGK